MEMSPTFAKIMREAPQAIPKPVDHPRGERLSWQTLLHADTVALEFVLASISVLSGIWILLPFDIFSAPFILFPKVFNEAFCGCWLLTLGSLRLTVLWRGRVKYRQLLAFLSFVTWLNLAAWIIVSQPERLAVVFFTVCSIASFWIFFRGPSKVQHRVLESHHERKRCKGQYD